MPGTIGSLLATLILSVLPKSVSLSLTFAIITFLLGWICCELFIPKYETDKDPGYVVIDEACGIFLGGTIIYQLGLTSISAIICNFLLFRLFDIWKPFPIRNIERLLKAHDKTVSLGIMLDDILAVLLGTIVQVCCFDILSFHLV